MSEVRAHSKPSSSQQLYIVFYIVSSFTCCHLVLIYWTGQSYIYYFRKCTNFCQFAVVVVVVFVVLIISYCCCSVHNYTWTTTTSRTTTICSCCCCFCCAYDFISLLLCSVHNYTWTTTTRRTTTTTRMRIKRFM